METKSRYEVIAELEGKKRELILQKSNLDNQLRLGEQKIKQLKRELEDSQEDMVFWVSRKDERLLVLDELIKGVDESLKRMAEISKKS